MNCTKTDCFYYGEEFVQNCSAGEADNKFAEMCIDGNYYGYSPRNVPKANACLQLCDVPAGKNRYGVDANK